MSETPNAFQSMDRMYRFQRHFYDLTRKYYLLGRDRLLEDINVAEGDAVLEAGCGTGRNLIMLAKRTPQAQFYGLDASAAMLETAAGNAKGLKNISFVTALAGDFTFAAIGCERPFNKIFFSFSISMIPSWRESIDTALENICVGGELWIVDFYDQKRLPAIFARSLQWWLSKFHVKFWPDLLPHLKNLESKKVVSLSIMPLYGSYSFIARMQKL